MSTEAEIYQYGRTHGNYVGRDQRGAADPDVYKARIGAECEAAVALSLSRTVTRDMITTGEQLTSRLPAVDAAFTAGDLDYPRARTIALTMAKASDTTVAALEADILAASLRYGVRTLADTIWKYWTAHDPDEASAARRKAESEERGVTIRRGCDGTASLFASMTVVEAAEFDAVLNELVSTVCPKDPRTKKHLRGDALIALAHHEDIIVCQCRTENCPVSGAAERRAPRRPALIKILVDIDTLLGLSDTPATLPDGTVLDAETARLLAENAQWQGFLTEMRDAARAHLSNLGADETASGTDADPEDESGEDASGRDESGQDESGQDESGQDESGRDESGRDESGRDESGREESGPSADEGDGSDRDDDDSSDGDSSDGEHSAYDSSDDQDSADDSSDDDSSDDKASGDERTDAAASAADSPDDQESVDDSSGKSSADEDSPGDSAADTRETSETSKTSETSETSEICKTSDTPRSTGPRQRPPGPRTRKLLMRGRIRKGAPLPAPNEDTVRAKGARCSSILGQGTALSAAIAEFLAAAQADVSLALGQFPDGHGGLDSPPPSALVYRPSAELVALVRATYTTCTFPQCSVPASRCDIDHIVPFDHNDPRSGGWTILSNLHPLCPHHHRAKTLELWACAKLAGDAIYWRSASGLHRITPPTFGTVLIPATFTHNHPLRHPTTVFGDGSEEFCVSYASESTDGSESAAEAADPPAGALLREAPDELYEPTWWEIHISDTDTHWEHLFNTDLRTVVPSLGDIALLTDPQAREDATYLRARFLEHRAIVTERDKRRPPPF
ncbi:HNH endonuclease signature motif containing protein [Rhodococcoides yunnanense]|uniref:HNH endonuclease signature motif containing protein n=1 Tax=Rhodococcoides yunnanense TaxID=278209 RepID=UPI001114C7F6|nr:HNH endonuclease signature motif containing protein [Rhodococcus yunnanensis]